MAIASEWRSRMRCLSERGGHGHPAVLPSFCFARARSVRLCSHALRHATVARRGACDGQDNMETMVTPTMVETRQGFECRTSHTRSHAAARTSTNYDLASRCWGRRQHAMERTAPRLTGRRDSVQLFTSALLPAVCAAPQSACSSAGACGVSLWPVGLSVNFLAHDTAIMREIRLRAICSPCIACPSH